MTNPFTYFTWASYCLGNGAPNGLAQAEQAAELRFVNLLTGQVALVVPVAGTGTERKQRVALAGLPAGQYAYQLVVEGRLAAAPQKLFVNP